MNRLLRSENLLAVFILLAASLLQAQAPTPISAALREKIDATVRQALTTTGVPSASIAIVQGGAIAYLQAYGDSRIEPHTPDAAVRDPNTTSEMMTTTLRELRNMAELIRPMRPRMISTIGNSKIRPKPSIVKVTKLM